MVIGVTPNKAVTSPLQARYEGASGWVRAMFIWVPGEFGRSVLPDSLIEFQNEAIERSGWFSPAPRVRIERDLYLEVASEVGKVRWYVARNRRALNV